MQNTDLTLITRTEFDNRNNNNKPLHKALFDWQKITTTQDDPQFDHENPFNPM